MIEKKMDEDSLSLSSQLYARMSHNSLEQIHSIVQTELINIPFTLYLTLTIGFFINFETEKD